MGLARARGLVVWAALAAGLLWWTAPLRAEESALALRGNGGPFSHTVRDNAWSQRSLSVYNASATVRNVRGGFVCEDPAQGRMFYSRQVEIPPGAIRRMDVAVRAAGFAVPGRRVTKTTIAQIPIVLHDGRTGAEILRDYRTSLLLGRGATVVANVVGPVDEHDDNSYLEELIEQDLGRIRFTATGPANMPSAWHGYEQADIVLLTGVTDDQCQASQIQSLLDWVRRGGVLVISGSQNLRDVLAGELGRACGVAAFGLHETARMEVYELPAAHPQGAFVLSSPGRALLAKVNLDWPVTFTQLDALDADVLYEAEGLPLLTRRGLGLGHVFCLATPLSALRPPSLQTIWRQVANARADRWSVNADAFATPGRQTLEQIAGRRGPDRLTAVTIILMPLVLVIGGGVALLRRRRGEWLWIILLPLGLALAIGMYAYGRSRQESPRLSNVGLVCAAGSDRARVQEVFAYYSGPSAQTVKLQGDERNGVIRDISLTASALSSGEVENGPAMTIAARVPANTTRAALAETIRAVGGIEGELTFSADGVTGTLTNRLGRAVRDCVLLVNERTYRLGDLPAGTATRIQMDEDDLLGRLTYQDPEAPPSPASLAPVSPAGPRPPMTRPAVPPAASRPATAPADEDAPVPVIRERLAQGDFTGSTLVRSSVDTLRNQLMGRLVPAPAVGRPVSRQPTLIGYMDGSLTDPLAGTAIDRQGWSAVVWPMRFSAPPAGQKVTLPSGFVEVSFPGSLIWDMMNRRFNASFANLDMLMVARPALPAGQRLEQAKARIRLGLSAIGYRLEVGGLVGQGAPSEPAESGPPTPAQMGRRVILHTVDNAGGMLSLNVDGADRFRNSRGLYVLFIRISRLDAQAAMEDMLRWQMDNVDVTLEGTVREQ